MDDNTVHTSISSNGDATPHMTVSGDDWELLSSFRPRLRAHVEMIRHRYRSTMVSVLEDKLNGESYQLPARFQSAMSLMTGEHTLSEIESALAARESEKNHTATKGCTRQELVSFVHQLLQQDLIGGDIPDPLRHLATNPAREKNDLKSQLKKSLLFFRIPLYNPDRLLERLTPLTEPLFTRTFFILLLCCYALALVQLGTCWPRLTGNFLDTLFTRQNLLTLWLVYPTVKLIHEVAHGLAIKQSGGYVHEMGIMILFLLPVPYVNGSATSSFANKWERIRVSSAGILAELFLASMALLVWAQSEPGLLRAIAFNVILVGGFSTLLFNGNPLVRYDGYFILSDLIEIPNLATRSRRYLHYLVGKVLLKKKSPVPVDISDGQKGWYLGYGIGSFFYRLTIYSSILVVFSGRFGLAGAVFGLVCLAQLLLVPVVRIFRAGLNKGRDGAKSSSHDFSELRVAAVIACTGATLFVGAVFLPLPYYRTIQGAVQLPDDSSVRAEIGGVVTQVLQPPGNLVRAGEVLLEREDPQLTSSIDLLASQEREFSLRKAGAVGSPLEARIIDEQLQHLSTQLVNKESDVAKLAVRAPRDGHFVAIGARDLVGKYVKKGELVGMILPEEAGAGVVVQLLVDQEDIDQLTKADRNVKVLLRTEPGCGYEGTIVSEHPQPTLYLPAEALGKEGGGPILTDPDDDQHLRMLTEKYLLKVAISSSVHRYFGGSRAFVRFHLPAESLASRWARAVRQLFLNRLGG